MGMFASTTRRHHASLRSVLCLLFLTLSVSAQTTPQRQIVSELSLCVEVAGASQDDGASIFQGNCNDGNKHQVFDFIPASGTDNAYHQIRASHSNKCLGVADGALAPGADIVQLSCVDNDPATLWKQRDGVLILQHSGYCLSVDASSRSTSGAFMVQWFCDSPSVKWQVKTVSEQYDGLQQLLKRSNFARRSESGFYLSTGTTHDNQFLTTNSSWSETETDGATYSGCGSYGQDTFNRHRTGPAFVFTIPGFVAGDTYDVTMGFAEMWVPQCQDGKRIMNITVNGRTFAQDLDVYNAAGGCRTALILTKSFEASSRGEFVIDFTSTIHNPMVSFIQIQHVGANAMQARMLADVPTASPNLSIEPTIARATNVSTIVSEGFSGLCVDILGGSVSDGAQAVQASCNGGDSQEYQFLIVGEGQFQVVASHSQKCLGVADLDVTDSADVIQLPCTSNTLWYVVGGGAYLQLRVLHSAKCLSIFGASIAPGTKLVQEACDEGPDQLWRVADGLFAEETLEPSASAAPSPSPSVSFEPTRAGAGKGPPAPTIQPTLSNAPSSMPSLSALRGSSPPSQQPSQTVSVSPSVSVEPTIAPGPPLFYLKTGTNQDLAYISGDNLGVYSKPGAQILGAGRYGEATFRSHRWGNTFVITIPGFSVGDMYTISLGFAEIYFCAEGKRVMTITVNDEVFEADLDVVAAAGACNTALVMRKDFAANSDGAFAIAFFSPINNAMVSFVEIDLAGTLSPTFSPAPSFAPTFSSAPTESSEVPSLAPSTSVSPSTSPTSSAEPTVAPEPNPWEGEYAMSLVAVAAANLDDGRILAWSAWSRTHYARSVGKTFISIFDPATNESTEGEITNTNHDMFCPGTATLGDGRIMITGGSNAASVTFFDPSANSWYRGPPMKIPRGYHSMTVLGDGSVFTLGGSWSGTGRGNRGGEVWSPTGGWVLKSNILIPGSSSLLTNDVGGVFRSDNHMWLFTAPNGKVFHAGPSKRMHWIDVAGEGEISDSLLRGNDNDAMNGNAVMFDIGKIFTVGGAPNYEYGDNEGTKLAHVIDINAGEGSETVQRVGDMAFARTLANSVGLPSGEVIVIGGQTKVFLFTDREAVFAAEIWSPNTGQFTTLAEMKIPRTYHSVAILMKDGRVWAAGGGLCGNCPTNHKDAEILTPPYLLNEDGSLKTRPVIQSSPSRLVPGETINVSVDTSGNHNFVLMRISAVTHSVNNDQRRIPLTTVGGDNNSFQLIAPDNYNVTVPGTYFLFAMNADGVPSVGKTIVVDAPDGPQPDPPLIFPIESADFSGLCVNIGSNSFENGAQATQYTCNENANQQFDFQSAEGGLYRIVAFHSQKCLTVTQGSMGEGANIVQQPCDDFSHQLWTVTGSGSDQQLKASHSGKCLSIFESSIAIGAILVQLECNEEPAQLWRIDDRLNSSQVEAPSLSNPPSLAPSVSSAPAVASASLPPTIAPAPPIFSLRTGSPLDLPYISAGGPASKTYQDPTPSAISGAGEYGDATFQRHRWGNTFTFTIPGFVAGNTYAVTLGFAELYFCAASSSRTMTISVNGESFATNLDVFDAAGGCNSALLLTQEFSANSAGAFVIAFASPIENAMISLIEVRSDAGPPLPSESIQPSQGPTVSPGTTLSLQPSSVPALSAEPTGMSAQPSVTPSPVLLGESAQPSRSPSDTLAPNGASLFPTTTPAAPIFSLRTGSPLDLPYISAGGPASKTYQDPTPSAISGAGEYGDATFQRHRWGNTFTFTIPGFVAGNTYAVTLGFAEVYFCAASSSRTMTISVNGESFATNLDVFDAAGGCNSALLLTQEFSANSAGAFVIAFASPIENAMISLIEVRSDAGPPLPNESIQPSQGPTVSPGTTLSLQPSSVPALSAEPTGMSAQPSVTPSPVLLGESAQPSRSPSDTLAPNGASLFPTTTPAAPIFSLRTGSPLDLPYISAGGPASKTYQDPTPSAISGAGEYGDATFQRHRWGNTFTFTIPGFVAGNTYAVTLGFAELYFCAASSSRTMTISVNGESFATNLDVFDAAGGCNSALLLTQEFSANSAGAFVIAFASPIENAMISLIEVRSDAGPPLPSESIQPSQGPTVSPGTTLSLQPSSVPALSAEPTGMSAQPSVTPSPVLLGESAQPSRSPSDTLAPNGASLFPTTTPAAPIFSLRTGSPLDLPYISAGGPASKTYQDPTPSAISGAGEYGDATFQRHRWGNTFTFTIPGFVAGSTYAVTLGFAEVYFCAASSSRTMTISINGESFATNLDVFGAAGGCNSALLLTQEFSANSAGAFVIAFASPIENAMISLIEVRSDAGPPLPNESIQPSQGPTVSPGTTLSLQPSSVPMLSAEPTDASVPPSVAPSVLGEPAQPVTIPSIIPSSVGQPSGSPLDEQSRTPSVIPSSSPSFTVSRGSSLTPSAGSSLTPSTGSSLTPSTGPSLTPSTGPSLTPSLFPISLPSTTPSRSPTLERSPTPSTTPSNSPSLQLSEEPSASPLVAQSRNPSTVPSLSPSSGPESSIRPSEGPSSTPSSGPVSSPSTTPSRSPAGEPSIVPSITPSTSPSAVPSTTQVTTAVPTIATPGEAWTIQSSAANNNWTTVIYGNGTFVAVAATGIGNRIMTSPYGSTWTTRASAADNDWNGLTYGDGIFVAVASTGLGNRVMTSPDGIAWASRPSAADNNWTAVAYGNGMFVAVAASGIGDRIMTSPDGITWTLRGNAVDNEWRSVTYGDGTFVAVASTGIGNRVMTSPDGIQWTIQTSAADNWWSAVTYGDGTFVAVAATGTGDRLMTSPDGITWTTQTSAPDMDWRSVTYGDGMFVAVASTGIGNRVMTSPDSVTWTSQASANDNDWHSVTYGNTTFVAVSKTGIGNRVMTSG